MGLTRDAVFFDALANHAQRSVAASELLLEMLDRLDDAPAFAKKISDLEDEADNIAHECLAALHQTWITPLDREEIHALITRLDDVLDCIEAASVRLVLFEIDGALPEARLLAQAVVDSCTVMSTAVHSLRDLKRQPNLLELCVEINKLENTADGHYRTALAALFRKGNDPLLVMKWRDIYDLLENATDRCEDVANIIEGIVLEHA
ncbi:Pit accessory protein [Sorangium cellulosum]|uniref:Pit accessory protein n=1 Tax=Sorangium cellulosum TaxID=56 RepID=A0A150RXR6_SORCE|nr:Pit accessory protein [Sorangium cellulosum]